jgi:hypothetical protein
VDTGSQDALRPTWQRVLELAFFGICLLAPWFSVRPEAPYTSENCMYVQQTLRLLKGHLTITEAIFDAALYRGEWYVPFPPFPSLLVLPCVLIWGTRFPMLAVGALLTVVNVFVLRRLAILLDARRHAWWVVSGLLLGTAYYPSLVASDGVYFFAHVVAVTMLLLAFWATLRGSHGYLAGVLLGCAFLTRQMTIYASVFVIALMLREAGFSNLRQHLRRPLEFAGTLGLFVGFYLFWNWLRFHDVLETGYRYIGTDGFLKARIARHGLFSLAYLPFNFTYLFLQGFHVEFGSATMLKFVGIDRYGTALTWASPFLFFALRARWPTTVLWGAWVSVALGITHSLLYYNNGFNQINGQRFSLDYLPVLILLFVRGLPPRGEWIWKGLVAYAVLLNVFALAILPRLAR